MKSTRNRNENALYLRLYREHDGVVPMSEFLHVDVNDHDYMRLGEHDRRIVNEMTRHEEEDGKEWNEDGCCDYESAYERLIELMDMQMSGKYLDSAEDNVRWCSVCGMPMGSGYYLMGDYACCDRCRNAYYIKEMGADDEQDAERCYMEDADEDDSEYYYTEWC